MSFALDPDRSIRRGVKDAVRHQLRSAQTHLELRREDAIHQARKSVKKARAIVALLELADAPPPASHKRRLRDAGRLLSSVRDSAVVVATFDQLRQRSAERFPAQASASMRRALVGTRTRIAKEAVDNGSTAKAKRAIRSVRRSLKKWKFPDLDSIDLAAVLKESYRSSRKAMTRARSMREGDLHRWRKKVKTFWYQLRLIEHLAPGLRSQVQAFEQLETWLGEHHDLAVLQTAIAGGGNTQRLSARTLSAVRDVSTRLQETIGRRALTLGQHLLAESPNAYEASVRRALAPAEPGRAGAARVLPPTFEGGVPRSLSP